jgi:hypothetical protein
MQTNFKSKSSTVNGYRSTAATSNTHIDNRNVCWQHLKVTEICRSSLKFARWWPQKILPSGPVNIWGSTKVWICCRFLHYVIILSSPLPLSSSLIMQNRIMSVWYYSAKIHGVITHKIIFIIMHWIFGVAVVMCLDKWAQNQKSRLEVAIMTCQMTSLPLQFTEHQDMKVQCRYTDLSSVYLTVSCWLCSVVISTFCWHTAHRTVRR